MADNEIKIKFTAEDEMQGKLDNIKAGFTALGVGIAVVAVAWKMATQEMKALSKAIEKNPDMFTKEQKDNVDQYNHSLKEVSTNFDQIKANTLAPAMAAVMRGMENSGKFTRLQTIEMQKLDKAFRDGKMRADDYRAAMDDLGASNRDLLLAAQENEEAVNSYDKALIAMGGTYEMTKENERLIKDSYKRTADAVKETTAANRNYLDAIATRSDAITDHRESAGGLLGDIKDEKVELDKLVDSRWWDVEAIEKQHEKIGSLVDRYNDETVAFQKNKDERIIAMVEEELAKNGLDEREKQALEDMMVERGLATEAGITQHRLMREEAQSYIDKINETPATKHTSFTASFTPIQSAATFDTSKMNMNFNPSGRRPGRRRRAAGGPVTGGDSFMVGERGPEMFTPGQSGNITPNNELGGGETVALLQEIASKTVGPVELARIFRDTSLREMQ